MSKEEFMVRLENEGKIRDAVNIAAVVEELESTTALEAQEAGLPGSVRNDAEPKKVKVGKGSRNWDKEQAMELYKKGLNDCAIAAEIGISGAAIGNWRKKNGLPMNVGMPGGKKDATPMKREPKRPAGRTVDVPRQEPTADAAHHLAMENLEAASGNPELMRAVELTFELLDKIWERI